VVRPTRRDRNPGFAARRPSVGTRRSGARLAPLVAAVAAGTVKVANSERLPLADAERAHQSSQPHRMTGKLVLIP
jgi:NADPH:quinone reductase-like Zn-dependent oxidoreductase